MDLTVTSSFTKVTLTHLLQARIKCIPQSISEEIESHYREADGQTRIDHQLGRAAEEWASVIEHRAPLRCGRLYTETEKVKSRDGQEQASHLQRRQHNDGWNHIRNYVASLPVRVASEQKETERESNQNAGSWALKELFEVERWS